MKFTRKILISISLTIFVFGCADIPENPKTRGRKTSNFVRGQEDDDGIKVEVSSYKKPNSQRANNSKKVKESFEDVIPESVESTVLMNSQGIQNNPHHVVTNGGMINNAGNAMGPSFPAAAASIAPRGGFLPQTQNLENPWHANYNYDLQPSRLSSDPYFLFSERIDTETTDLFRNPPFYMPYLPRRH